MTIPLKAIFDGPDLVGLGEFTAADTIPVAQGGTGATTAEAARTALGLTSPTFAETVIAASGSTTALRITQTGTGEAIRVEDEANPDATPFVVGPEGRIGIGVATPQAGYQVEIRNATASPGLAIVGDGFSPVAYLQGLGNYTNIVALRANGSLASPTTLTTNQPIGFLSFQGHDGTAYRNAASLGVTCDGAPGLNSMPTRVTVSTTPSGSTTLAEAVRIDSSQRLSVGGFAPTAKFQVRATTEQQRLDYDATHYASFTVGSTGILTIAPTGGLVLVQSEYSIGNLGASYQVNLTNGTKQHGTLNASCTISLATPTGACTIRLRLVNSGAGNTITVSGVRWVGGTAPTFDTVDTHENIIVFDYGSTGWVADGGSI